MKRLPLMLLIVVALSAIGIVIGASSSITNKNTTITPQALAASTQQDPPGMIDGAKNPEKIPDQVAYSALFRFIAAHQTPEEKNSIRAYIRQIGIGKQACKNCPSTGAGNADIDALITAAEDFQQRIGALDSQAAEIKDRHFFKDSAGEFHPNGSIATPEERAQLKRLQRRKESIVNDIAASLSQRLSVEGTAKIHEHVNERIKRKIKISASQSSG